MTQWNPTVYERYKAQRDRPALDLMLQIPRDLEPTEIWDLGCGTGEHAAVLAQESVKTTIRKCVCFISFLLHGYPPEEQFAQGQRSRQSATSQPRQHRP